MRLVSSQGLFHSSKLLTGHQANYSLDCSSSSSSSLPETQRTDPSTDLTHIHIALPSRPESIALSLISSSKIPSSTLSSVKATFFITSVTPSVPSTAVVASSSVSKTTGSVLIAHDALNGTYSPVPSDTPQRHGKSKSESSRPVSSVSLALDTLASPLVEVDRIAISTTSSSSPTTATFITPTAILSIPSFTGADSDRTTPPSECVMSPKLLGASDPPPLASASLPLLMVSRAQQTSLLQLRSVGMSLLHSRRQRRLLPSLPSRYRDLQLPYP